MRILITGGCGFLGSHLVEHFLKTTPYDIVVLDKLTYASNGFDRLRDIDGVASNSMTGSLSTSGMPGRLRVIGCDLSQSIPDGVIQEVGAVDYVIHAAAESHVDNSITDPLPFLMSNVIGTHHLLFSNLVQCRYHPRRTFIVSTDEVYGPAPWEHDGFDETAPYRPANPYAASKAGAECVAFAYANTYKLPITIVNTMNLIGERQHPEKFVPLVIRRVLAGEKVLIHADPTKTRSGTRFYLHCRTFANALAWMIRSHDEYWEMSGGKQRPDLPDKIHVCGEREMSNLELAQAIAGFVGKPLNYELVDFHSSRPGHDLRYAMDDSLIRQLGWQRPMGIMDSLKKTVEWYLSNQRWLDMKAPAMTRITVSGGHGGGGGWKRDAKGQILWMHDVVIVNAPHLGKDRVGQVVDLRGDKLCEVEFEPASEYEERRFMVRYDQVVRINPPQPIRQPEQRPAWCDVIARQVVDALKENDCESSPELPEFKPLPDLNTENEKFESYVEPPSRQPIEHEDDENASMSDYQVGIFADPIGADFDRADQQQAVERSINALKDSVVSASNRIAELEAERDAAKLVVGAVVEIVDGPARGCRGRIKGMLRQGVLFTVGITWAPDQETAKYVELAMTFTADQVRAVA